MFKDKIDKIVDTNNSLVCIGLDPIIQKLPTHIQKMQYPFFEFAKEIINKTHDLVCCYKPNSAFYEAMGASGIEQLKMIFDYLRSTYPEIPTLLDAKRADIDSTNEGYVQYTFNYLQADAVTLHPYLGRQSLMPFLQLADKGLFILCHTSNKGAEEIQELKVNNKELYKILAENIAHEYNSQGNCFLVVGATYPDQLKEIREIVGDMTILVPGIGAQGGDLEATLKAGLTKTGKGMLISSSRSIIYASDNEDFDEAARMKTIELKDAINKERQLLISQTL
jgi:orotidine-5'-phosphate decarboxylase